MVWYVFIGFDGWCGLIMFVVFFGIGVIGVMVVCLFYFVYDSIVSGCKFYLEVELEIMVWIVVPDASIIFLMKVSCGLVFVWIVLMV